MDGELSAIKALERQRGTKCWRKNIQDPELAATIDEALARSDISASAITAWVNSKGVLVGQNMVARHRRGDCRCTRG